MTIERELEQQREFKHRANRRILHMEACVKKALEVIGDVEVDYGDDNLGLSVMLTEAEGHLNLALKVDATK